MLRSAMMSSTLARALQKATQTTPNAMVPALNLALVRQQQTLPVAEVAQTLPKKGYSPFGTKQSSVAEATIRRPT